MIDQNAYTHKLSDIAHSGLIRLSESGQAFRFTFTKVNLRISVIAPGHLVLSARERAQVEQRAAEMERVLNASAYGELHRSMTEQLVDTLLPHPTG